MAITATTSAAASTCICRRQLTFFGRSFSNSYVSFTRKPTVKFVSVRCSGDDVATSTEETEIEVPKGPPSLISALNAERAIRGVAITDIDFYGVLGLKRGCPYDQVKVAYEEKLGELMKQGLEQEELTKKLDLLKESYTILSSVEDRRLYDWSLARNGNPDRYAWPFEVDITQTVTVNSPDTPPPQSAAITDIDFYGVLGLKRGCPYDQVKVAYEEKLGELMKQGLEQEELTKKLDLLKESYTILSSVEDRRLYDWSLARNGNPDRYAWPFEVDITQTVTVNSPDTPPPQEPEDTEPTRLVGYFLLTWIILSITLSIAFNR
ncbi:DnaJ domain-containing protein [Artemisia annua]|uniref:DnaJ domain-containing protein n=1 Tax=Artemisia annua TaxID=35608 RepID=A0A2U1NZA9_ARTAN|nr:DnaJ domain-containing protein [Artemisia annua]